MILVAPSRRRKAHKTAYGPNAYTIIGERIGEMRMLLDVCQYIIERGRARKRRKIKA